MWCIFRISGGGALQTSLSCEWLNVKVGTPRCTAGQGFSVDSMQRKHSLLPKIQTNCCPAHLGPCREGHRRWGG